MAVSLCKPPDAISFTGNAARNWQEFQEQLTWFLAGTESADKADSVKIGIMLTHARKEVQEIYKTLLWSEPDNKTKFNKVLKAFKDYCQPGKNKRHKFWSLKQEEGKPVDAYNTRIKVQIDHCEYEREGWPEAVETKMIRDKFVFGICDDNLKERLLRETDISLNRVVALAQRTESSKQHIKEMIQAGVITRYMDAIHEASEQKEIQCGQCCYKHRLKECPTFGQQCLICHKLNHFAKFVATNDQLFPRTDKQSTVRLVLKRVYVLNEEENILAAEDEPNVFINALYVHGV